MMDITKLIGKKDNTQAFVSFVIGKNWIQAGIWSVINGQGELLSVGTSSPWQNDVTSFIDGADDSLASAAGTLQESPELSRVVFGLPALWVVNGKVESGNLRFLKELCEKLELTPSGFVIIPESIVYMLRQKEGGGESYVLVGLAEEEIEIAVVRAGRVIETKQVARSISLGDDVVEGLTRFEMQEKLPARIILYDRHLPELTQSRQELVNWEWPQSLFLHTPRIEILPPDSLIAAVSESAAIEIAHVKQFQTAKPGATDEDTSDTEEPTTHPLALDPDSVGPEKEQYEEAPEHKATPIVTTELLKEESGSATNKVLKEDYTSLDITQEVKAYGRTGQATYQEAEKTISPGRPSFLSTAARVTLAIPERFLRFVFGTPGKARIIIFLFLLIIAISGLALWYFPSATVTIYLAPKRLEQDVPLALTPSNLSGRIVSIDVAGEKITQPSGTKTVGDRARGEVTILNNTAASHTFAQGTILSGPNNLKFTLQNEVKVASESGVPLYKPGEAKTQVTAKDIGAEYNIAPGNIFSIANFETTSFSARNDAPFTGGSARDVSAIKSEDQERIEQELTQELTSRAINNIGSELTDQELLIPESAATTIKSRKFSGKPQEEASTLSLSLELRVNFTAVARNQLLDQVKSAIGQKVPPDFTLTDNQISFKFIKKNEEEAENQFTAHVTALLLPRIDTTEVAKSLVGKDPSSLRSVLIGIPGFTRSTIRLSPRLAVLSGMLGRLPARSDKIAIEIEPEQ